MRTIPIADGVFGFETKTRIGPGIHLPLRMTALRCAEGLALVSPIEIDDELEAELKQLGPVRYLLAPNLLHHAFLSDAHRRFPEATLLGPPGLADKRKDLTFAGELRCQNITPELSAQRIDGVDKLSEAVFFHVPSRSLIVTDLVFNISDAQGLSRFVLSVLSRAHGRVEQSRLLRSLTTDRKLARQSIEKMLELPFERVVMAHGEVIEHQAKARLRAGLWWMLGEERSPSDS